LDKRDHVLHVLTRGELAGAVPRLGIVVAQAHRDGAVLRAERLHLMDPRAVVAIGAVHQDHRHAGTPLHVSHGVAADGHGLHAGRKGPWRSGRYRAFKVDRHDLSYCHGKNSDGYTSTFSAAMNASCGMSTLPNWRMRFLPSFCFSSSLRLRVASPP